MFKKQKKISKISYILKNCFFLPSHDDEKVQAVPAVAEVGVRTAGNAHGQHLDDHLRGEEGEDNVIGGLQHPTPRTGAAGVIGTGLVHAQRHAVEENGHHADSLEPCVILQQGGKWFDKS